MRRLVELGRAARADSGVRTRQPLGRALVSGAGWAALPDDLRRQVADELNVGSLEALGTAEGDLVDVSAKANFRALGKRFGQRTPRVAEAVAAADAAALSASLTTTGVATVQVDGETIPLTPDEVVVTEAPRSGWAVAADAGETVALDLEITPSLRRAGLAREAVRMIQEARKTSGFDVSDRIVVRWAAVGETAEALEEHAATVAEEVLALAFDRVDDTVIGLEGHSDRDLGLTITLERKMTSPSGVDPG